MKSLSNLVHALSLAEKTLVCHHYREQLFAVSLAIDFSLIVSSTLVHHYSDLRMEHVSMSLHSHHHELYHGTFVCEFQGP